MARPERFELPTAWFVARYSIQLSYGRARGVKYPARPTRLSTGVGSLERGRGGTSGRRGFEAGLLERPGSWRLSHDFKAVA